VSALLFNIYFVAIMVAYHKRIEGKGVLLKYNMNSNIFDVKTIDRPGREEILLQDIQYADDAELFSICRERGGCCERHAIHGERIEQSD